MTASYSRLLESASDAPVLRVNGRIWRQREFAGEVWRVADVLSATSEIEGQFVLLEDPDPVAFYTLLLACLVSRTRCVFPVDRRVGGRERLSIHGASVRIMDGEVRVSTNDGHFPLETDPDGDIVCFSSGSTGEPKGVVHHADTLLANAERVAGVLGIESFSSGTMLSAHLVSAVSHFLVHWITGSELAFIDSESEDLSDLWGEVFDRAVVGSPLQVMRLAYSIRHDAQPRFFFTSGDFMYPANISKLLSQFPQSTFYNVYGLAEVGGRMFINRLNPDSTIEQMASVGHPIPGVEVEIRDEELWVRSDLLFSGYLRPDFEKRRGWFQTGDLGSITEFGLVLRGRKSDEVKVAGHKVSTRHIESRIAEALGGFQSALFFAEHRRYGTIMCLAIVEPVAQSRTAIIERLREHLLPFELPHRFYAVASIPLTSRAKIDRKQLRWLTEASGRLL